MAEVQMNTEVTDNNNSGSSKETKDENVASVRYLFLSMCVWCHDDAEMYVTSSNINSQIGQSRKRDRHRGTFWFYYKASFTSKEVFLLLLFWCWNNNLQNRWTLWYDNPGKKTNQQSWGESLKKIVTFDTVSTYWNSRSRLASPFNNRVLFIE